MQMKIIVDLSRYDSNILDFNIEYQTSAKQTELTLSALGVGNGIDVLDLKAVDDLGSALTLEIEQNNIVVKAQHFFLTYAIHTTYTQCVGADKKNYFTYPFINSKEVFWGTGVVAYPQALPDIAADARSSFQINNLPAGWKLFSNIAPGEIHPATLEGHFVYCSPDQDPYTFVYQGMQGDIAFHWLVQSGKTCPIQPDELQDFVGSNIQWLERHLAPMRTNSINFLVLQAPSDFEQLANGQAFATGENVLNGIVTYAPQDPNYLRKFSAGENYREFLLEGLVHELMHFYTTTTWQGLFKSYLFPAENCHPIHARLLGEALNLYYCLQWLYRYLGKSEDFIPEVISRNLSTHLKSNRRSSLLDVFLLDVALQRSNMSLLQVFSTLVNSQQTQPQPYQSVQVLLDAAIQLGWNPPLEYPDRLLDETVPQYFPIVEQALADVRYSLHTADDNQVIITRSDSNAIDFSLPD